ncbi:MAG: hypothetical protein QM487_01750 [Candidatus Marithrix sp.]
MMSFFLVLNTTILENVLAFSQETLFMVSFEIKERNLILALPPSLFTITDIN